MITAVKFQSMRPMLRTKDLHATVNFYKSHLGFVCNTLSAADGWASLRQGPVEIMVAAPNSHMPFGEPAFTGSFYFNVDDVAALWAAIKDNAVVCYPMEDFHYGMREFAIYDWLKKGARRVIPLFLGKKGE